MKKSLTIILLSIQLPIFGQLDIKGKVLDSLTSDPLPYVNISILKADKGTYSNLEGLFNISANKSDSILFSFVGYNSVKYLASDIPQQILMAESITQLTELVVSAKKTLSITDEIGFAKNKRTGIFRDMKQAGLFLENSRSLDGFITEIFINLGNRTFEKSSNKSRRDYRVRVKIYKVNKNGNLSNELIFNYPEIIDVRENQKKIKLKLIDYYVPFPKQGCLLSIEFLGHIDEEVGFIPYNNTVKSNFHFAPEFSGNHNIPQSWINSGEEWVKIDFQRNDGLYINFNFGIEVGYYY